MPKISWKNKRCPKCGNQVNRYELCISCGRQWSKNLEAGETAIKPDGTPVEDGQSYQSVIKPKKTENKKAEESPYSPFTEDLPEQFKDWEITNNDGETEIHQKRSLMRLDSRRIYNQMGLAVRAHDAQKNVLICLSNLMSILNEDEKAALSPIIGRLKIVYEILVRVQTSKIYQATKMEKIMEKAHHQARKVRLTNDAKRKQSKPKLLLPQDSEGMGLTPVAIEPLAVDPVALLEEAKKRLLNLEKKKKSDK